MRYPNFLSKGGTIGFIAPSFGCSIEPYKSAFNNALITFKNAGFCTKLGPNCYESSGIGISNTPKNCGNEVQEAISDHESDILISCGGGELMCEILDHIDFHKIKKEKPKWFMGYSDNTNLTFLLPTLCDTAALYGPCAANFGSDNIDESVLDALRLLTGKKLSFNAYEKWEKYQIKDETNPLAGYNLTETRRHKIFDKNYFYTDENIEKVEFSIEGRLLGGCLDCLQTLAGTKYDRVEEFNNKYIEDGIIWFLEACDLNVFSIRRALWQLDHIGWFKNVKGFLIGRSKNSDEIMGLNAYEAYIEILKKYDVPIIMDMDIGHLPPMLPIISGGYGRITVKGNALSLDMELK